MLKNRVENDLEFVVHPYKPNIHQCKQNISLYGRGGCYFVFNLFCVSKVVLIHIKQESFFKNWKNGRESPCSPPLKIVHPRGEVKTFVQFMYNLFKMTAWIKLRQCKKKKYADGAELLRKNYWFWQFGWFEQILMVFGQFVGPSTYFFLIVLVWSVRLFWIT